MSRILHLQNLLDRVKSDPLLTIPEKAALEVVIEILIKNEAAKVIIPEIERQIIKPFEKLFKDQLGDN